MPALKNLITNFKSLRTSRKFSIVLFISFIITAQLTTILITIGILNFSQLLSNIKIPSGYINLDIDVDSPETMTVQIPFVINNPGIFELSDIKIIADIHVNYINKSNQINITSQIFSKTNSIGNCKALHKITSQFEGSFIDFLIPSLIIFLDNSDELVMIYFFLDIQFYAKYMGGLIQCQFTENDLNLFNF